MSDTAAVPEPVSATGPSGPTGPTGTCCSGLTGPAPEDVVNKSAEELAKHFKVADWKKPSTTALVIYAQVALTTDLPTELQFKVVEKVLVILANQSDLPTAEKQAAVFFATEVLPHVLQTMELLTEKYRVTERVSSRIKDFAQKEMKGVAELVIPEVKKVSSWCCK